MSGGQWLSAVVAALAAMFPLQALSFDVAVYGSPSTEAWNEEVRLGLEQTGLFETVDAFLIGDSTPTLSELEAYHAVLVYSDATFDDSVALGDVLADYMDGGGGVVLAALGYYDAGGLSVQGRLRADGYLPFTTDGQSSAPNLQLEADLPDHPILSGVTSLDGGTSSYHNSAIAPVSGAVLVAHWSNGEPLVATWKPPSSAGTSVGLNLFPPSSDSRADLWDSSTDGDQLLANALSYAVQPKVALLGAVDPAWNEEVAGKIAASTSFGAVDTYDVSVSTPSLSELLAYDALLVYSDLAFADNAALGDVVADFVDTGGGVVVAALAFEASTSSVGLAGRVSSESYLPFTQDSQAEGEELSLVPLLPEHQLLEEVVTFHGGVSSFHNHELTALPGVQQVASWTNGQPLIGEWGPAITVGTVVGLNFYPPSSDSRFDLWDTSTDGAVLLSNSLGFAAANLGLCPDMDSDGAAAVGCGGTDCDDLDSATHPGATEVCDWLDNDCDGDIVDEFGDLDGDGEPDCVDDDDDGDGDSDLFDCDPQDPAVSNLAIEVCDDGVDNDCDGFDLPCNDLCEDAIPLATGGSTVGQTLGASPDSAPFCSTANTSPGVWYSVQAQGGDFTLSTCNQADYDTKISVYTGSCGSLVCVAGQDDSGGCALTTTVTFDSSYGEDYLVLVHGFNLGTGSFTLSASEPDPDIDDDGDPNSTDCSPSDPTVHAGATEACDTIDSDCDGDLVDSFDDSDGDGDPDCTDDDDDDDGAVDTADCASLDPTIYPAANEQCDSVDSDCDGSLVDEFADLDSDGLPDCVDEDDDDDGSLDVDDCAPTDSGIFPGAVELCDWIDSDCDGDLVEGFDDLDADGIPSCIDSDADGDGALVPGDCDDLDPLIYPGAVESCDLVDSNCDGTLTDAFADLDADGVPNCVDEDDDDDLFPDEVDCAPLDSSTYPNAPEECDWSDSDCDDDLVDEFLDTDLDLAPDCIDVDDDDDGLLDEEELLAGSNPLAVDTDGDGVEDYEEVGDPSDPDDTDDDGEYDYEDLDDDGDEIPTVDELSFDVDGDGVPDHDFDGDGAINPYDGDSDADGLTDWLEGLVDPDGDLVPAFLDLDSDGDGLLDGSAEGNEDPDGDGTPAWLDPDETDGPDYDGDGDGLTNGEEAILGTDAYIEDTDEDSLTDGDEVQIFGTDPLAYDTDGDGLGDGDEVNFGTDPLDASDPPQYSGDDDDSAVDPIGGGEGCDCASSLVSSGLHFPLWALLGLLGAGLRRRRWSRG